MSQFTRYFVASFALIIFSEHAGAQIIAQYHFDEVGGTTAFASVGSVHGTLSPTGSSFVGGGIAGNAISLNRVNDGYVTMGNFFGLPTGDFSIVLWVNTTTTQTDTIALAKHNAGSQNGYLFPINPTGGGGVPNKATFVASEFVSNSVTSSTDVNDGVWHQIVGVYQAGGNQFIYVDGSPSEATNGAAPILAQASDFLIGGVNQTGVATGQYTGLVDEVQIYQNALSPADVDFLFANPSLAVPEPSAMIFLGAGTLAGWMARRRRRV